MRLHLALLTAFGFALLSGCGGGGGGGNSDVTVENTQFRVNWPTRTRAAMQHGLTSAQSATVVFSQAGLGSTNVTVGINRDPGQLGAYTGTYTIPVGISPERLGSLTATFYSLPAQAGVVVGTATSTATLTGTSVEFAAINLTGTITQVGATPTTMGLASEPIQLEFTAQNAAAGAVAVSPGSATWTVVDGADFISVTPDGMATPLAPGTAHVRVTVDGVASDLAAVEVQAPSAPAYAWAGEKGGNYTEPSFDAVEGNQFQIVGGKNVVVTKLGYEAARGAQSGGITAIFDASGNIIASATITAADPLTDGYHYKEIPPLILVSGQTYHIGSLHGTGPTAAYYHDTATATPLPFILDLGTAAKFSSTIEGGNWSPGGFRHYVGNFQAYQVP